MKRCGHQGGAVAYLVWLGSGEGCFVNPGGILREWRGVPIVLGLTVAGPMVRVGAIF